MEVYWSLFEATSPSLRVVKLDASDKILEKGRLSKYPEKRVIWASELV